MSEEARQAFEKWISSPPFEQPISRYPQDPTLAGWPGCYRDYCVQLAWEAWQEAWNRRTGERSMSEELKPCPFCGGEVCIGLYTIASGKTGWTGWIAECANTHCAIRPESAPQFTREHAVVLWNRRTGEGDE